MSILRGVFCKYTTARKRADVRQFTQAVATFPNYLGVVAFVFPLEVVVCLLQCELLGID